MEALIRARRIAAQQFGDAPHELLLTIDLAMNALHNGSKGEALNELNRADKIVKQNKLEEWEAEMSAAWAVYYFHTGDERQMYEAIIYAQRREPENKRIADLKQVLMEKGENG